MKNRLKKNIGHKCPEHTKSAMGKIQGYVIVMVKEL